MTEQNPNSGWNEWARHVLCELQRLDASQLVLAESISKLREEFAAYRVERAVSLSDLRADLTKHIAAEASEKAAEEQEARKRLTGPQIISLVLGVVQLAWLVVFIFNQLGAP